MKIANVRSYIVNADAPKNLVFVRVETGDGTYGWGEAYTQTDRDTAITAHVERLGHYLIGRSPFNIKHFSQVAYEDFAAKRGAMDFWVGPERHRAGAVGHRRQELGRARLRSAWWSVP